VRHPIYLGWLQLVWPVWVMTGSRFVFAVTSSLYLVLAIPIEERELRRTLGAAYDTYARRVRWRMVPFVY
jgi:protein-S-isoprenylcysteine O-methyltransferase Ste14